MLVFSSQHKSAMDKPTENGAVAIEDPVEFKRISNLFPLPESVDVSGMTMEVALNGSSGASNENS